MWKPRLSVIFLLVIIAATLASVSSVYMTICKFRNVPFSWDSGAHAYEGLRIAQDLRAGDFISFFGDTYRQGWWPFVHSWLLAPALILFGSSYAVARGVSLLCFLLFVPILYGISLEMSEKYGHWVGLMTAYLALTSLPLLVLSAMCMSEIPGLLMTFITFLVYLKARKHQHTFLFVFTAILMALTLFTKWHHGVFVIFAIFLTQFTSKKKFISRSNLSLFLPFLIIMAGWFIYPRHITSFVGHSTFQPQYFKFLSLENWIFYPRSFFQVYHSSWILALIVAIAFLFSLRKIKDPRMRLFVAHVLIGIVLMTIKLDNRHRYIITLVPSIWVLGTNQLVVLVDYFRQRVPSKKFRMALVSFVAVGISIITLVSVPRLYKNYADDLVNFNYYSDEKPNTAYEYIARNIGLHNHIEVFGSWDYFNSLNSPTLRWHVELSRNQDSGEKKKKKAQYYFLRLLKRRNKESFDDFIQFLEHKDVRVEEYHLMSFMNVLDKKAFQEYRRKRVVNPFADKIADFSAQDEKAGCLVTILNEREKELNRYAQQYMSEQDEWIVSSSETFSDLGIAIIIYERETKPGLT